MGLITFTGFTLLGAASYTGYFQLGKQKRELKELIHEVLQISNVETKRGEVKRTVRVYRPRILRITEQSYGYDVLIRLPKGYSTDKFRDRLDVIAEATDSTILTKRTGGRDILLRLGMCPMDDKMDYEPHLMLAGRPTIPYHTPFGLKQIDFWDEACCHIIVAGATRMGKSVFLRLLFTNIILSMNGNVRFFYVNNKVEDYYPLQGIPQLPAPAESIEEALGVLRKALKEINERKTLLRSSKDCVNIKQYREKHRANIPPMFVVFDEFGRFTDEDKSEDAKELQRLVQEIAETAGYLDVHLVIATQRPDATTVLKPRIRANILARVCFQTVDEKNSEIVVHTGAAAHLEQVKGRAVVLDGMPTVGQVPYLSEDMTAYLLSPYRRDELAESTRPNDTDVLESFSGFEPKPLGADYLSGRSETMGYGEPNHETARPRRTRHHTNQTKGRVLSLHAESDSHSSGVQ